VDAQKVRWLMRRSNSVAPVPLCLLRDNCNVGLRLTPSPRSSRPMSRPISPGAHAAPCHLGRQARHHKGNKQRFFFR
jgi:hypothetical protein